MLLIHLYCYDVDEIICDILIVLSGLTPPIHPNRLISLTKYVVSMV